MDFTLTATQQAVGDVATSVLDRDLSWDALVSGGVDVSYDDPITCVVSTAGGVPVNAIVGGTPSMAYLIVGGPGVKAIAVLKGKRVGSAGETAASIDRDVSTTNHASASVRA